MKKHHLGALILAAAFCVGWSAVPARADVAQWAGSYNVNFDWTCTGMDDNIQLRWILRTDGTIIQIRYYDDGSEPRLDWGDWELVGPNGFSAFLTNGARFQGTFGPTGIAGSITAPSQACFDANRRYLDNGDGTVNAVETGLVWQQGYSPEPMSWEEANGYCSRLELGGRQDWGLPSQSQLSALRNLPRVSYHLDDVFSYETGGRYWTHTSCGSQDFETEMLFEAEGSYCQNGVNDLAFVRCLAGGQVSDSIAYARVREFILNMYLAAYHHRPSEDEYEYWGQPLSQGHMTGSIMAMRVMGGEDYARYGYGNLAHIENLCWAVYGRPATDAEKAYWVAVLDSGMDRVAVNNQFIFTDEFSQYCRRYGIAPW